MLLKNAHLQRFPDPSPCQARGQAYCGVHANMPLADLPTHRRGKRSLLIRRDATLRIACLTGRWMTRGGLAPVHF